MAILIKNKNNSWYAERDNNTNVVDSDNLKELIEKIGSQFKNNNTHIVEKEDSRKPPLKVKDLKWL